MRAISRPLIKVWGVYTLLALAVLLPVLKPGYILTLDMVFTPKLGAPTQVSNTYVWHWLLHIFNFVLPGQVIEKLILFVILLLCGVGMHRLIQAKSEWPRYFGGIFYVINPFTYDRFMAGQYLVLLGYALLPWFVRALFIFITKPNWRALVKLSAWSLAISLVSLHILGMALLVAIITVALASVRLARANKPKQLKPLLGYCAAGLVIIFVASSYWLIPALAGHSPTTSLISSFDGRHLVSFRTANDVGGSVPLTTLSLNGFWGDREGLYLLPMNVLPFWYPLLAIILAAVAAGAYRTYKTQRFTALVLLSTLLVAWILAQGIVNTPFAGINRWLYDTIPWYSGYREAGKFIALVALSEVYFFGIGMAWLIDKVRRWKLPLYGWALGLALALPLLYTPSMLWGFAGQLHAVNYPADWYQTNSYLAKAAQGKVLFLPWHQYMYFSFAGRLIANPAKQFFQVPLIHGDNAEIGLIKSQVNNPQSTFIENNILAKANQKNIGQKLASLNVHYVLLAKEADWRSYQFLDQQPDLRLVSQSPNLKLYRNQSFGGSQ